LPRGTAPRSVAFTTLAGALWSAPALAILNVEELRLADPPAGVSGNIDLSVSGKAGNTDKQELALDGRIQNHRDDITDFLIVSYDYGQANDARNANATLLHGRHVVQYLPWRAWEAFTQLEQDEFTRLSLRGLLGGGLRVTIAQRDDDMSGHLGVGAFYSHEKLEHRAGLSDHGTDDDLRGSFYFAYKRRLDPQVSIASTTYYQPNVENVADFRVSELAALVVKMSGSLSLKLLLNVSHDSRPPQAVESTDVSYTTSVSYQF
jgi:putative salt-induced outer membrane protein YdiY